jgi:membrane protease YdiL (CAAX protease family)
MSQLPPPTTAPAGWYPDPSGHGVRYFDGVAWAPAAPIAPVFATAAPHPELPMRAAIGALVILTTSLIIGKLLVELLVDLDWPLPVYVGLLVAIGYGPSVAWCLYVRRRWADGSASAIGWSFRWSDLGWGPLTWLGAIGTQVGVAVVVLLLDVPLSSNVEEIGEIDADRAYVVATVVTAVIAAPIVEELVFRGVVLRGLLSRLRAWIAIPVQGLLFGAAHVDPVRGLGNIGLGVVLGGVGVALGVAAYLLRRIGPTVVAHAIFNGVVLVIVLTGVLDDIDAPDLGGTAARVLGLVASYA